MTAGSTVSKPKPVLADTWRQDEGCRSNTCMANCSVPLAEVQEATADGKLRFNPEGCWWGMEESVLISGWDCYYNRLTSCWQCMHLAGSTHMPHMLSLLCLSDRQVAAPVQ